MISVPDLHSPIKSQQYIFSLGIFAAVYFTAAELSLVLSGQQSAVWYPAGFALAVILLSGYRMLPAIALGSFLASIVEGMSVPIALGIAAGTAAGALAGAYLLNRAGFRKSLERLKDVLLLVVPGGMISAVISPAFSTASFYLSGIISGEASGSLWFTQWLANVLGIIVFAPVLLTFSTLQNFKMKPVRIAEALALLVSVIVISAIVFSGSVKIISFPYILFPFFIWAAVRFSQAGASIAILMVSVTATWFTARGQGVFMQGTPAESVFLLQEFTGVAALTVLILASVIIERKMSEDDLRDSEERNRRLVNFSPYGIAIHSGGKLVFMNPAGAKILGSSNPDDFIGKNVLDIIHPGYHEIVRERIHIQELGKVAAALEEVFVRSDGTPVDVEITSIPFTYEGKPAMYGVFRDITERKKAEDMRIENLRLEAADKAKSEFLANMSHELRTPLNVSIGFSQLLKKGTAGELREQQEHYVNNILESNQFLLCLINDILDLSKVESGKIEIVREKMSVPGTINETLSLIKEKAFRQKINLRTKFDNEPEFIMADKQRFKQILFNLLSNAVKFTGPEGTVTITAKKEFGMVKISVSDTGIGIKEENMGKLFRKFEQVEYGINQKYGGTGLGLAITKQLVELHGGEIWAESKFGEGSTFSFTLPINGGK